MKLLFDARWVNTGSPDGITRYSRELISAISKHPEVDLTLLVTSKIQSECLGIENLLIWNKPVSLRELVTSIRLRKYGFDAVYSPHFVFGGLGRNSRLITTVMDLIPFHHKEKQSSLIWRLFFISKLPLKLILQHSDVVASISKASINELKALTKKPLIELPCGSNLPLLAKKKSMIQNRRLLYIGRYEEYKNTETLIRSMKGLDGYTLVLAGKMSNDKQRALSRLVPEGAQVEFRGFIKDEEYVKELSCAYALVTASTDEGFGLPVLEAMKAGTPVVCSSIDVFKEVGGSAALYFDPSRPEDLTAQVLRLKDEKIRSFAIKNGLNRSQEYSWDKSANKLLECIGSFIKGTKELE